MESNQVSKRDHCIALLKKILRLANTPEEILQATEPIDLSMATDAQVDIIHSDLLLLQQQIAEANRKNGGKSIFKSIQSLKN